MLHPTEKYYPLRPEFAESTFYLYQATKGLVVLLSLYFHFTDMRALCLTASIYTLKIVALVSTLVDKNDLNLMILNLRGCLFANNNILVELARSQACSICIALALNLEY